MAVVRPFRAVRPTRESAATVSSVPYDVVNTEEARALASGHPLSFLHVTRSEIDLPAGTDPYSPEVYAKARENFAALRTNAPMIEEDDRTRHMIELRAQTGVVFLTYRASEGVEKLSRVVTADPPIYDFRADDG